MTDPSENESKAPEESTDQAGGIPSKPTPDDKLVQDQMAKIEVNAEAAGDPEASKTDPAETVSDASDGRNLAAELQEGLEEIRDNPEDLKRTEVSPTDLPRYKCHKTVQAFKIASMESLSNGDILLTGIDTAHSRIVDAAYVDKHHPRIGGYYVRYHDRYQSWSPARAFESGYTLA